MYLITLYAMLGTVFKKCNFQGSTVCNRVTLSWCELGPIRVSVGGRSESKMSTLDSGCLPIDNKGLSQSQRADVHSRLIRLRG